MFVSEYFSKLNYKQFQVTTDSSVLSVFPLQAVSCISEMLQKCFPELDRKYTGIPDDEKGTVLTQYEHFKNVCDMMTQTFPSLGKILELHQFYSVPFNMELMCSLLQYLLQRRTFVWNLHSQHTPQSHDISDINAAYNGGDSNWYKVSNQYPLMKEKDFQSSDSGDSGDSSDSGDSLFFSSTFYIFFSQDKRKFVYSFPTKLMVYS